MATRTTRAERRWRRIVDEWRLSGLSAPEFAKLRRGISAGMIYAWSSRLGKQDAAPATSTQSMAPEFLPVEIIHKVPSAAQEHLRALEVVLPHGEIIRVPPGADMDQLGRVVLALRGGLS